LGVSPRKDLPCLLNTSWEEENVLKETWFGSTLWKLPLTLLLPIWKSTHLGSHCWQDLHWEDHYYFSKGKIFLKALRPTMHLVFVLSVRWVSDVLRMSKVGISVLYPRTDLVWNRYPRYMITWKERTGIVSLSLEPWLTWLKFVGHGYMRVKICLVGLNQNVLSCICSKNYEDCLKTKSEMVLYCIF